LVDIGVSVAAVWAARFHVIIKQGLRGIGFIGENRFGLDSLAPGTIISGIVMPVMAATASSASPIAISISIACGLLARFVLGSRAARRALETVFHGSDAGFVGWGS
jgi:hypothetical protein